MSQKYEIGDLIDKGSFSEVYKFINKKNSYISAGKIITLEKYQKHMTYCIILLLILLLFNLFEIFGIFIFSYSLTSI